MTFVVKHRVQIEDVNSYPQERIDTIFTRYVTSPRRLQESKFGQLVRLHRCAIQPHKHCRTGYIPECLSELAEKPDRCRRSFPALYAIRDSIQSTSECRIFDVGQDGQTLLDDLIGYTENLEVILSRF